MKSIITIFLITLLVGSCSETPKDYATVSGKIYNPNKLNKITLSNRAGYSKEIKINEDGTFSDTLKIEEGIYRFLMVVKWEIFSLKITTPYHFQ